VVRLYTDSSSCYLLADIADESHIPEARIVEGEKALRRDLAVKLFLGFDHAHLDHEHAKHEEESNDVWGENGFHLDIDFVYLCGI
jgi:hypothetical protein